MKTKDTKLDKYKTFFNKGKQTGRKEVKKEIEEIIDLIGKLSIHNSLEKLDFVYIREVDINKIRKKFNKLIEEKEEWKQKNNN